MLKQLIENMIYDYLEESYEDDLVESIFEEVSEDTWEAIQEAILNELSPELRNRYADAASKSHKAAWKSRDKVRSQKGYDKHTKTMDKRKKGLERVGVRRDAESGNLNPSYINKSAGEERSKRIANRVSSDLKNLSADEFERRYRMSKTEWKRKNK